MRVAIHGRKFSKDLLPYIAEIFDQLNSRAVEISVSRSFCDESKGSGLQLSDCHVFDGPTDLSQIDFVLSLGGDGTFLDTLTHVGRFEIPILGINLGRLGFLANVSKDHITQALTTFFDGRYSIDERTLIHVDSLPNIYGDMNFALNEFAIMKKDTASMVIVNTFIDGEYLNSYWADGLMVSTPTGSTGYSLSCGGPVVLPQSSNFIITPVSPHNLNVRPLIVSDSSVISFQIESRGINFLTSLDTRSYTVDNQVRLSVRKEAFTAKLVKLEGYTFLDTLRNKLNWGYDTRN